MRAALFLGWMLADLKEGKLGKLRLRRWRQTLAELVIHGTDRRLAIV